MKRFLRRSLSLLLPVLLSSGYAYGKKEDTRTGTMVYAQFDGNSSDSVLYFYLNDPDNNVFGPLSADSPFGSCSQLPCLTAQTELLGLQVRCAHLFASPFCAAAKDYPYTLKTHKGTPSIAIGFSDMGWIEVNVSLTLSSALHDASVGRLSAFDKDWKPATANAWVGESLKLQQRFGQMKEQESRVQYDCLTHLKMNDPISSLDQCGLATPNHTNSDLRGEQRIYHVFVWGGGMYVGYREVIVYVDAQQQTIENVQWDDKIHSN